MTKSKPNSTASHSLLAVDAGGTKTAAWLVDSSQSEPLRIVGRGRSSAGNPLSVGFEEATRAIVQAVSQACQDAGHSASPAGRAIMSIAGAMDEQLRRQFIDWVHTTRLADKVAIVSDVLPVLAAGTPDCCGVALVAGTGSVAFGRAPDGRTARCGGWGYLLGDEGSGYAIGRAALNFALHSIENNDTHETLARAVLNSLGTESVSELTKTIYRCSDPRALIASLAPLVIEAAEEGEPTAEAIVDSAACELANTAARAARSVGLGDESFALAVAGGVLVSSPRLRNRLHEELKTLGLHSTTHVVDEPLYGCVCLAAPEFASSLVTWH